MSHQIEAIVESNLIETKQAAIKNLGACRVYITFHKNHIAAAPRATLPRWGTLRPLARRAGKFLLIVILKQ